MDYHLDHKLRLNTEPEYKSLYQWAINETDAEGRHVGGDQIPWRWTLNFTATSCVLIDSFDIKAKSPIDQIVPAPVDVAHSQFLRAKLRPGSSRDEGDFFRQTTFSMFGTDRAIEAFSLEIYPITNPSEQERCIAWGVVSNTTEIDFQNETTEDCLAFYLFVKPETFALYAAKVSQGAVDELVLSVGMVAGFYSNWSPSSSTRDVKVLTDGDEQKIDVPVGFEIELPG